MARKQSGWKTKGMNRDLSASAFNPEFAFENRNLRLSTNDGNTMLSWVNERGPKKLDILDLNNNQVVLLGTPIGTAVLNDYLIVFTHNSLADYNNDYIYRLNYGLNTEAGYCMFCRLLYSGTLGFSIDNPIETLVSYESEEIQKVYWTDGINQPRVINISPNIDVIRKTTNKDTLFDFVPELLLQEDIYVKKNLGGGGIFTPGVIQYAFTYYNKYGLESNIFYITSLFYISFSDRGASPDEKVDNTFTITFKNLDPNFDFIRIYSILRTSVNAVPFCKRLIDLNINQLPIDSSGLKWGTYTDTGVNGDNIDPTELLYKGGYYINVGTMEQKDGTLFLGDIVHKKPVLSLSLRTQIRGIELNTGTRTIKPQYVSDSPYQYSNQLTSTSIDIKGNSVPCGTFKRGDVYRLGLLFQDKYGIWSEPVYLGDKLMDKFPNNSNSTLTLPIYTALLESSLIETLRSNGYIRVRPLVVFPELQDRNIIAQGVAAPTMIYSKDTEEKKRMSSWFFRPYIQNSLDYFNSDRTLVSPLDMGLLYTNRTMLGPGAYNPVNIRGVEIEGDYNVDSIFTVDKSFVSLHSPDFEFNDLIISVNFSEVNWQTAGYIKFIKTLSDISVLTETPTISSDGSGFIHKSFTSDNSYGIISGLFYEDFLVDDENGLVKWRKQESPWKFLIYPWQGSGSLNNDIIRPANEGIASAILQKKVISNLRYANTTLGSPGLSNLCQISPQLFYGDATTIIKMEDNIYVGNVDTILNPDHADGKYFAIPANSGEDVPFNSTQWAKTFPYTDFPYTDRESPSESPYTGGVFEYRSGTEYWDLIAAGLGDDYNELNMKKMLVRMKYRSTPHLVLKGPTEGVFSELDNYSLPIIEITKRSVTNRFGGTNTDALKANNWLPCGEPVILKNADITVKYEWGDTYYQRYDCVKTYPFTTEDENQIVEIGSFMLETKVNIDGRYDRNRGQTNNLNVSPRNFNLINPVYGQLNNFFIYKMTDDSFTEHGNNQIVQAYPNRIIWSKTKQSGADIDLWTNVTLASVLEVDGDKGPIRKLTRLNNLLLAFLDTGISQILYNETVQIASKEGVPIELANSEKVQGKRYITDTIGCSNKWSMAYSPAGIYFMDSIGKNIWMLNSLLSLTNISSTLGFDAWSKVNIPGKEAVWNSIFNNEAFVSYYDRINQEILFINNNDCLAFSEKVQTFTSFYSYEKAPYFCNLKDTGIWIAKGKTVLEDLELIDNNYSIFSHLNGVYGNFFGVSKPYSTTLIANTEPTTDKIFTNLEFRACVNGEGENTEYEDSVTRYNPYLPFDYLEAWNEYQHGVSYLLNKHGHSAMVHYKDNTSSLKRKFRIWRCDIPRNNLGISDNTLNLFDSTFDYTFHNEVLTTAHPNDRMRNTWIYLKLVKQEENIHKTEVHDLVMTYYN